jgi:hypothetical protein
MPKQYLTRLSTEGWVNIETRTKIRWKSIELKNGAGVAKAKAVAVGARGASKFLTGAGAALK